jgi:hypothetical protein
MAEEVNPFECEGYIICDANFNRIKVKSSRYVAATTNFNLGFINQGVPSFAINEMTEECIL